MMNLKKPYGVYDETLVFVNISTHGLMVRSLRLFLPIPHESKISLTLCR